MLRWLVLASSLISTGVFAATSSTALPVVVSVAPLQTFVEAIGGDHVQVSTLVPSGRDPHFFSLTPKQIATLHHARLFVGVGLNFEANWRDKLSLDAWLNLCQAHQAHDDAPDSTTSTDTEEKTKSEAENEAAHHDEKQDEKQNEKQAAHSHHEHHEHHHHEDPHCWTDPLQALEMGERLRDQLSDMDPAHRQDYHEGFDAFADSLRDLDARIRAITAPLSQRRFLVFHPSWGAFANRYALVQTSVEQDGKMPSTRALAQLLEAAKRDGVRVMVVQPQFNTQLAIQIIKTLKGSVIHADPLASDYFGTLHDFAHALATQLAKP